MKCIIAFTVLFVMFLFARLLFGYYVETVPVFAVLLTPLLWLCVVSGVLAGTFTLIRICKEITANRNKHKDKED